MQNTKLVTLLRTFDKKELKEFEKFVASPFHSGSRDLMPLLTEIKKYYPKFDNPRFTGEEVFQRAFKGKKFDEGYFRKMLSFLYKMGEDFLVELELREKHTERDLLLLKQFRRREMESAFIGLAESIDKELKLKDYRLEDYFSNRLRYIMERFEFYYEFKADYKKAVSLASDHLESATGQFIHLLLKGFVARDVSERAYSVRFNSDLLDPLEKSFNLKEFFDLAGNNEIINLLLADYYIERAFLESESPEILDKAIDVFLANVDKLSQSSKYTYFRDLLGAVTAHIFVSETGEQRQNLRSKYFELTKLKIEHNALLPTDKKYLSMVEYIGILKNALSRREFEWTENFITGYNNLIETPHRKNIKEYSFAMLMFSKGEHEKSLEHLALIKPTTDYIKYDVRELSMVLFYELGLGEEARYTINNTQRYYDTNKELGSAMKRNGLNFLRYYKLLINYMDDGDKETIEMNFPKLKEEKIITGKPWLMTKFREITGESL